jgi:hypothetical protein
MKKKLKFDWKDLIIILLFLIIVYLAIQEFYLNSIPVHKNTKIINKNTN